MVLGPFHLEGLEPEWVHEGNPYSEAYGTRRTTIKHRNMQTHYNPRDIRLVSGSRALIM